MVGLVLAMLGSAAAGEWSEPRPYVIPHLSVGYVSVNGQGTAQGIGGADVGVRVRQKDKPHLLSDSRVRALGMYGLSSGAVGADLRLGSFIGPDGKLVRLMTGPDFFYSGYGERGATNDYYLAWSPGLDIRNTALFKIHESFRIGLHVIPGWAFDAERHSDDIPVFNHVNLGAVAMINAGPIGLTVGVERQINSAGTQDYIVLGAGI